MCFIAETNALYLYISQRLHVYSNNNNLFHLQLGASMGKVDPKSAPVFPNHNCFGQRPKGSSSKVLFTLGICFS